MPHALLLLRKYFYLLLEASSQNLISVSLNHSAMAMFFLNDDVDDGEADDGLESPGLPYPAPLDTTAEPMTAEPMAAKPVPAEPVAAVQSDGAAAQKSASVKKRRLEKRLGHKNCLITPPRKLPMVTCQHPDSRPRGSDKVPRASRGSAGTFAGRRPPKDPSLRATFDAIKNSWHTEQKEAKSKYKIPVGQDHYLQFMQAALCKSGGKMHVAAEMWRRHLQACHGQSNA